MTLREFVLPAIGLEDLRPAVIGFPEDSIDETSRPPVVGSSVSNLLGENGWNILMENGRVILLE